MKRTFHFRLKAAFAGLLAAAAMAITVEAQTQSQRAQVQSQSFQQVAPKQPEKTTQGQVLNEEPNKPWRPAPPRARSWSAN